MVKRLFSWELKLVNTEIIEELAWSNKIMVNVLTTSNRVVILLALSDVIKFKLVTF